MNSLPPVISAWVIRRLQAAGALALVVLVAGCVTLAGAPVDDAALEFELQGRIALRYGNEGGNARIAWRHAVSADDLMVTNPIGQGIARITRQRDEVMLFTADGKEYRALDAEALTQSVLGWRLPLAGLPDWVRARPVPGRPAQLRRLASGQIEGVEQDGWLIEYQAWDGALPTRMKLSRNSVDGASAIEIRLIIDQWTLPADAAPEVGRKEARNP